jgi:hypothetical protein
MAEPKKIKRKPKYEGPPRFTRGSAVGDKKQLDDIFIGYQNIPGGYRERCGGGYRVIRK